MRVGAPVEGVVYERISGTNMCQARQVEDLAWELYPVEGPADVDELSVVSQAGRGDARIQTHHNVIDGVTLTNVSGNGLFDSELETPCLVHRTSAGGWVCLPENSMVVVDLGFSDDACSEPVAYSRLDVAVVAHVEQSSCTRDAFAFVVLGTYAPVEAYEGPLYARNIEGDCELYYRQVDEGHVVLRPVDLPELEEARE